MIKNNLARNPDMRTEFIYSDSAYAGISSTVVKERLKYGLDCDEYLPENVVPLFASAVSKKSTNK